MERTVIVTGGFGFLGRKVSNRLREEGFNVVQMALPGEDVQGLDHIIGDITDPSTLDLPRADIIVHCAGILESSHPTDEMMYKVNHGGTVNIYNKGLEIGVTKFVMISSISAIGPHGTFETPMTEDTETRPDDTYGRSKMRAEQFLVKSGTKDGVDIIILRPTVLYGPGMNVHSSGMKTFTSIHKGIMPLVGDGDIIFNMLHVENMVQAILLSVTRGKGVRIYNVSEGPYTLKEIIGTIEKEMGKKGHRRIPKTALYLAARIFQALSPLLREPPPISMVKYRGLTSSIWHTDSSRIRQELGYEPVIDLQEGVRTTVREYGWAATGKKKEDNE